MKFIPPINNEQDRGRPSSIPNMKGRAQYDLSGSSGPGRPNEAVDEHEREREGEDGEEEGQPLLETILERQMRLQQEEMRLQQEKMNQQDREISNLRDEMRNFLSKVESTSDSDAITRSSDNSPTLLACSFAQTTPVPC